jgi:hypothetical protein
MKKLIPFLVLLAGVSSALAQGTVTFVNSGSFPTVADRLVYLGADPADRTQPAVGTNYMVQLYYGADAGSLAAHTAAPNRIRNVGTTTPGTWSGGGTRTLTGYSAGAVVTMQIRAWDSGPNGTFDWNTATIKGQSSIFTYTVPAPGSPAPQYLMDGLRAFAIVVPEPSIIGLGVIGIGALVLLRRRK